MCNKSIICGVLFSSAGAITFYEGNNMLSVLAKYVINILIHGLFHIAGSAVNFKVSKIKLWQNKYNKQLDLIF